MSTTAVQASQAEHGEFPNPYPPDAPPITETFALCEADASNTLGGNADEKEPEHPSVLGHLIRQLRPQQDLTRVLIPAFFLEPRSLLEKMADVMMHPQLLLAVPKMKSPMERFIGIVKWYLSGWHFKTVGIKKPFNPIIGETFSCAWRHDDGSISQYIAEQVSHRPPVSAIYFENRKNNIVFDAQIWTQSRFAAPQTAKSILVGGIRITLTNLNEEYFMTFPTYYCHNLLIGTMRMEVGDYVDIVCTKTGYSAHVDFNLKPTFGGADKINSLNGVIKHGESTEIGTLEGHWDKVIYITPSSSGRKEVLIDVTATPVMAKYVLPESQQGLWESRRLWHHAAELLRVRPVVDWDAVETEKAKLEEDQRKLPCHHHESPGQWYTKLFHTVPYKNPVTQTVEPFYKFIHLNDKPFEEGESELNLLWLSQQLPDLRTPSTLKTSRSGSASEGKADGTGDAVTSGGGGAGGSGK